MEHIKTIQYKTCILGSRYLYYYQHYLDLRRKDKLGRFKNKMHDEHSVFQTWKSIFHFPKLKRARERKLDLTTLHAYFALLPIRKKGNPRKSPVCSMAASIVLFTQLEKQKHLENSS